MDPGQFLTASRVLIVAGKGGVGKTTVSAALARAASSIGLDVLLVEVEGKSGLADIFGQEPLAYREVMLAAADEPGGGVIRGRTLTPDDALIEYLHDHGLSRISKRLVSSGALDMVATATPGIKDVLILGKVKQLERAGEADLIILDAPAAGHAIQFLRSARGLVDAVRMGPIFAQASDVLDLLTDPARCQVMLVTLAEETPVNELIETAYSLEDQVGISLSPVVVNGIYPDLNGLDVPPLEAAERAGTMLLPGEAEALASAAAFRRHRIALQKEQWERLAHELPLPQLHLPYRFTTAVSLADIDALKDKLLEGISSLSQLPGTGAGAGTGDSAGDLRSSG